MIEIYSTSEKDHQINSNSMSEAGKMQNIDNEETSHNEVNMEEGDEVDALGFTTSMLNALTEKRNEPAIPTSPTNTTPLKPSDKDDEERIASPYSSNLHAEEYHMQHRRRGVALIFNHLNFDDGKLDTRDGTKKDGADLQTQLTRLGFEVRVHNDLKEREVKAELQGTSKEDHSDADCLLVFVMSHGIPGYINARDTLYHVEDLWKYFTGNKCHSLRGKPKMFFIQACRGNRVDSGVQVATDSVDSALKSFTIPSEADILVGYSTVKEYFAWRSKSDGSWYVQALCEELRTNGQTRDLLTMLTFVNRRVALSKMSQNTGNVMMDSKVQMPTFTSMLTRLVFFRPKTSESSGKRKNDNTLPPAKQGNLAEHKPLTNKDEKANRRFK